MPSFPGSVKSFASRSAGQAIGSAHINDLQDEVTAIEDGLRNGTAPLNSSNSTLASLNITGAFTVNGAPVLGGGNLLTKSTNYTVSSTDGSDVIIEFNGTGLSTVTLYTVVGNHAKRVTVKNGSANSTSIVTVDGNSTELIDSTLTYALNVEDAVTMVVSTTTLKWIIV